MGTDSFYMEVHCVCPESLDVNSNWKLQRKKQKQQQEALKALFVIIVGGENFGISTSNSNNDWSLLLFVIYKLFT